MPEKRPDPRTESRAADYGHIELPKEQDRFRMALEQAPVGVALVDMGGTPFYLNPAMSAISGVNPNTCERFSVFAVTHADDLDLTRRLFGELLDGRRDRYVIEKRYYRPDGIETPARLTISLARDHAGTPSFAVVIAEDMAEVQDLRHRLARTIQLDSLAALARGIAHDFNNLLTTVFASLELMLADPTAGPSIRKRAEGALASLDRIRELTRQLQEYARGRRQSRTLFALTPLVDDVARTTLSGTGTKWRVTAPADLPEMTADRAQIAQVLSNLLLNASQAMDGAGEVDILVGMGPIPGAPNPDQSLGDKLRISIRDRGPGIPDAILGRIFEPYFTTRARGTGLGLAICDSIVQAHCGRMTVRSEAGHGTQFDIVLPLECSLT